MAGNPMNKFRTFLFNRVFRLEQHETLAVAWSFAFFFCVLSSYFIIRPVRETMAVGGGPDTIPFLFMATFLVTLVVAPIFGWIASHYPRRVFLPWIYLFFVSNILIFWAVFSLAVEQGKDYVWLGRVFFVWISVYILFAVSLFWSFMADIFTREQGRRLFGVITAGGSIGALLGGTATSLLVKPIGFQNLFPISATLLLLAVFCIANLRRWVASKHENDDAATAASDKPLGGNPLSGITHIFSSRYFGAIVISSVMASLLGTALYMFTAKLVEVEIPSPDERTQFFSNINNAINALALIGQLLVIKHVVKHFGIGISLSLLPVASIAGFVLLAVDPVLGVVAFVTIMRRALGFGFGKPTSDMLYSVVTPEEKYKTKNFIDTAVYRGSDVIGTWSVQLMWGLGVAGISIVMLPFAVLWTVVTLWLGRDYRRQAKQLRDIGVT